MSPAIRPVEQSHPELQEVRKNPSVRRTMLRTLAVTIVGITLTTPCGQQAFARSRQTAASQAPDIEPGAMDALQRLGTYLRTLQSFQVTSDMTTDQVLEDGEIIQSSKQVNLLASRPNRLRMEITGDDQHRLYFFDGKTFTIYGLIVNYYATVPAPGTLGELTDVLNDKYGIEFPLADLFQWGTKDETIKRIKGAQDIGPAAIDGVTCEQYAFRQDGINWQIWIQLGQFPLPRKLVIQTLTDEARPQHTEKLSWNLAPSFSEDAFTFTPPADAKRIAIAQANGASTGSKQ